MALPFSLTFWLKHTACIALVVVLLPVLTYAGTKKLDTVYVGTATLSDGRVMTYKLSFSDSMGNITGFSTMDINGPDETKTSISGTLSKRGDQLYFKELSVVWSKAALAKDDFCTLQASLKAKNYGGTIVLKGHFEGYVNGGNKLCASGKLVLISPRDAFSMLQKLQEIPDSVSDGQEQIINKKAIVATPGNKEQLKPEKSDIPPVKTLAPELQDGNNKTGTNVVNTEELPRSVPMVLPGKSTTIVCKSSTVTLEIWDGKTLDGDVVSLMQGNTALLKNYEISATHYQVKIDLNNKKTDTLHLIAVSEGSEPLATARLRIASGGAVSYLDVFTSIDKESLIILKRE